MTSGRGYFLGMTDRGADNSGTSFVNRWGTERLTVREPGRHAHE